ncbi:hypothetical protein BJX64DRAFT_278123 [Aspergillus heterothallicus]
MYPVFDCGLAMTLFAPAPFLGPVLGPTIGGFLGMIAGWRWVIGSLAAFFCILLFRGPIVLLLSVYMAIIYGTLYMCFGAFPIVSQGERHWNPGVTGLAFLSVMVSITLAMVYSEKHSGFAPPEAPLPPCLVGSITVPVGLL